MCSSLRPSRLHHRLDRLRTPGARRSSRPSPCSGPPCRTGAVVGTRRPVSVPTFFRSADLPAARPSGPAVARCSAAGQVQAHQLGHLGDAQLTQGFAAGRRRRLEVACCRPRSAPRRLWPPMSPTHGQRDRVVADVAGDGRGLARQRWWSTPVSARLSAPGRLAEARWATSAAALAAEADDGRAGRSRPRRPSRGAAADRSGQGRDDEQGSSGSEAGHGACEDTRGRNGAVGINPSIDSRRAPALADRSRRATAAITSLGARRGRRPAPMPQSEYVTVTRSGLPA